MPSHDYGYHSALELTERPLRVSRSPTSSPMRTSRSPVPEPPRLESDGDRDKAGPDARASASWSFARTTYRSTLELDALLVVVLRDFTDSNDLVGASVSLPDHRPLRCLRKDGAGLLEWGEPVGGLGRVSQVDAAVHAADWPETSGARREALRSTKDIRMTIDYAGQQLGELLVRSGQSGDPEILSERCRRFTEDLTLLIHRDRVRQWSREHLGVARSFVGLNPSLREIERQIERASRTSLPVMIHGEFGTEVLTTAIALHCGGVRRDDDFVISNCATLEPQQLVHELEHRNTSRLTLFLQGVDELSPATQRALLALLPAPLGLLGKVGVGPRLIASTTRNLARLTESFSRSLLAELEVLSISLPPLRERIDDIDEITRCILHEHHRAHPSSSHMPKTCDPELERLLRAHSWPGNFLELERTLLQLAIMSETISIRLADVQRYNVELRAHDPTLDDELDLLDEDATSIPLTLDEWVEAIAIGDVARLEMVHEGLYRALSYMSENYREPISLSTLAKRAHLSTSHLSYLFKSSIGSNFKTLLARLRIEKAKQLLAAAGRPRRITDVAAETGFGDLSHFEKTFRRFVNMCPREYRKSLVGE